MKNVYCKTLQEFNDLPKSFTEFTIIHIQFSDWVSVVARENSRVVAWENSSVVARENSRVVARENSRVVARENSSVVAWENSSVEAWGNSSVEAWGNSSVEAWGNSSVVAWGNSSVVAWGNSRVVAWGNSSVEAWGNSSVEARGNSRVINQSVFTDLSIMFYAVCFMVQKTKNLKRAKTATIINPNYDNTISKFIELNDVKKLNSDHVLLYKRVSVDLKTQEETKNETVWCIGKKMEVPVWSPEKECGAGKFHACSRTFFCDEFRYAKADDRYIAISVKISDLYTHKNPQYPHKIAFRKGRVLYEVDRDGKKKEKV
jgi:hypothetical protein